MVINAMMKVVLSRSFGAQRLLASRLTYISSTPALISFKPETYLPAIKEAKLIDGWNAWIVWCPNPKEICLTFKLVLSDSEKASLSSLKKRRSQLEAIQCLISKYITKPQYGTYIKTETQINGTKQTRNKPTHIWSTDL